MSIEATSSNESLAPSEINSPGLEIKPGPTISSPYGELHLIGTNEQTGKVILAGPGGVVETTPDELGAWQMVESGSERFQQAEVAEDLGEAAVESTSKLPEAIKPQKIMRAIGRVAVKYLEYLGAQSPLNTSAGGGEGGRPPEKPPAPPGPEDGQEFDWGDEDDEPSPYVSDWNYDSHEDQGDKVRVKVVHADSGEKKEVTVSKNYFEAWEKGDDLPEEKSPEELKKHPVGSLDRLGVIDYEPTVAGGGAPGPSYDMEDIKLRAELAHLRMETVEKAIELGVKDPIDYLAKARLSPEMSKRLQQRGWDMTPPPENETPIPKDPVLIESERGARSRQWVNQIIRMIETPEGQRELLAALQRPGELPLGIHHIPIIGHRLGRRVLAWRIYQKERHERVRKKEFVMTDGSKETRSVVYNDGLLGLGTHHVREILNGLESLDESVRVNRSKLSLLNRHKVMGDLQTPRRDLAQQIDKDLRELVALKMALDPKRIGFYEHQPFKDALKEFEAYKDPKVIAKERNEFVRLRMLEVRTPEQQARFDQLLSKHKNWGEQYSEIALERNEFVRLRTLATRDAEQEARLDELRAKYPSWA